MRQSVREAAYLRMLFGQQFTVDAMGPYFSATDLFGGEGFVRKEVAKLEMAVDQYQHAESDLVEGLHRVVANGPSCLRLLHPV